jgi:hypothetical protein
MLVMRLFNISLVESGMTVIPGAVEWLTCFMELTLFLHLLQLSGLLSLVTRECTVNFKHYMLLSLLTFSSAVHMPQDRN